MNRIANWTLVAGLLGAAGMAAAPPSAVAAINLDIAVQIAPPALPVYEQPLAPAPGYLWTPGYWAWSPQNQAYYWVPGAWVLPPQVGLLWTPGWWGWSGGFYRWNPGYWAPQVGFYGGIDYGWGYSGNGYTGGQWRGDRFYYNTAVTRVNVTQVRNVYVDRTVIVHRDNHVSYNGGAGGIMRRPDARQRALEGQRHFAATPVQERWRERAQRAPDARFQPHAAPPMARPQPNRPAPDREEILRQHDTFRGRPGPQGNPQAMPQERPRVMPQERPRVMPQERPHVMPPQRGPELQRPPRAENRDFQRQERPPAMREPMRMERQGSDQRPPRAENPGVRPGARGPVMREQARPEHRGGEHRGPRRDDEQR